MPAGLPVEVVAKVPSRYYRIPRYFFTVLTVAHNQRFGGTAQFLYDFYMILMSF